MPENNFDIYQTESGYTAVTNEVRRAILTALAKRDRGLPELVKITGKAKPTLSSVHMKELLQQKLIQELPHPTDNRRKVYRLVARRIGSSNVPVEQLRNAVKQYVALTPMTARLPIAVALEALAAAPRGTAGDVLAAQARRLGTLAATLYPQAGARDLVTGVAGFLEHEALARPLRLDLEHSQLELEVAPDLLADAPPDVLGLLLGAFVEGVLRGRGLADAPVRAAPLDVPRRLTLHLPAPAG